MVENLIKEQVRVPAQIGYLRVLRKFVTRVGLKYGFSASELYAFKASVDEACSNIIEHGYEFEDGSITIKAIVKNDSFTIELVDQGKAFDPQQVENPNIDAYINTRKKGGLGIFIMRRLLDKIDYERTKEGNVLRLTKFRESLYKQDTTVQSSSFFSKLKNFLS